MYSKEELQKKADTLNPYDVFVNLTFTARHPKRVGVRALTAWTKIVEVELSEPKIEIEDEGDGQYTFKYFHHIKDGKATVDWATYPADSLDNLLDVLKLLEDGKF